VIAKIDGQEKSFDCDYLISTIPLNGLGQLLIDDPSKRISDGLELRHLVLVYVFLKKTLVLKDQWIFFPERKFFFGRIFEQKQMNPELAPADKTMICCDLTCTEESDTWKADDKTLAAKCIESLKLGGFINDADVEGYLVKKHRNFYPCYGLDYAEKLESTYNQFKRFDNLLLTGRLGMFNYNNSDHCYDMGRFLSDKLSDGLSAPEAWKQLEERVKSYKIVD
jgi:protoporphyrinogen oxidase